MNVKTKIKAKTPQKAVKASAVQKPGYQASYDLLMSAVDYTRRGMPNRAAKALADAAQDPDIDQAMEQLNNQQQALMDQDFDTDKDQQQQMQQTSKALAKLIKASQQSQQDDEEQDAEDEDEDKEEAAVEETAGDDFDTEAEDDLDIEMDGDDFVEQEQQVQSSVQARLAQRERNRKTRA